MGLPHFVVEIELQGSTPSRFILEGSEAHHLTRVLRLGPGDLVRLVDGRGGIAVARIVGEQGQAVALEIVETGRPQEDRLPVDIIVGVLKGERMDWLIQKATELAVRAVHPVLMEHTVVRMDSKRASGRLFRWRQIARQALKQCRGLVAPVVYPVIALEEALSETPRSAAKMVFWECEGEQDLVSAWREQACAVPVTLVIGPEGGLSSAELQSCRGAGFRTASLGRRTLRAETAAIAGIAVLGALMEWREGGRG